MCEKGHLPTIIEGKRKKNTGMRKSLVFISGIWREFLSLGVCDSFCSRRCLRGRETQDVNGAGSALNCLIGKWGLP